MGSSSGNGCGFWGDSETLSITDNGREILQKRYCSAYGGSEARIVSDARTHYYVLLKYSEGHGTNAWTDFLTIYELTSPLQMDGTPDPGIVLPDQTKIIAIDTSR
jgi:hypothetical protein